MRTRDIVIRKEKQKDEEDDGLVSEPLVQVYFSVNRVCICVKKKERGVMNKY